MSSVWRNVELSSIPFSQSKDMHSWPHNTMDSILTFHPAAPGSPPGIPNIFFQEKIVDVADVNQQPYCLEQWTEEAQIC